MSSHPRATLPVPRGRASHPSQRRRKAEAIATVLSAHSVHSQGQSERPTYRLQQTICMSSLQSSFHPLFTCDEFRSWDLSRRHEFVKINRLCLNCLSRSHMVRDCSSTKTCRQCGAKHHTLLHRTSNGNSGSLPTSMPLIDPTPPTDPTTPRSANVTRVQLPQPSSLLSTAYVSVIHKDIRMTSRALLDPGATISLITSRMVHALGLPKIPHHLEVVGLGREETSRIFSCALLIWSRSRRPHQCPLSCGGQTKPRMLDRCPSFRTRSPWQTLI